MSAAVSSCSTRSLPASVKADDAGLLIELVVALPRLEKGDYELDEKTRVVTLTEAGNERVEQLLTAADMLKGDSLYDSRTSRSFTT